MPWSSYSRYDSHYYYEDDELSATWYEHFAKGFASMGVLGFLKVLLASPFSYFRLGGGGRARTGRDRVEQVSWIIIVVGVGTFLVVCVRVPRKTRSNTNELRLCTKVFVLGVVELSNELAKESWTSETTTMTTSSFRNGANVLSSHLTLSTLALIVNPHILKLPHVIPQYGVD